MGTSTSLNREQLRFSKSKVSLILILAMLVAGVTPIAQSASSSAKKLVAGFEKEIIKQENAIALSKNKADKSKELNRLNYTEQLKSIESDYVKALAEIQANLQSKLNDSNNSLAEAKQKWEQVNKVKLTTGFFGSDLSRINNVLECIPPYSDGSSPFLLVKRYCANNGGYPVPGDRIPGNPLVTYGGADWQKDDATTINFVNANNAYLSDGIKYGFVVPQTPNEFEATRQKIAQSQSDIEKYTKDIVSAKKNAEDFRFIQKLQAEDKWIIAENKIDETLEKDIAVFSESLSTLKFGLKAAKRAAKQSGNLKTSFTTALQFAYNANRLDDLASAPLSYIDSLKSLRNIVEITNLSEEADLVDTRYTQKGASRINRLCGNVFIKEKKFKDLNYEALLIYSKYVLS